MKTNRMKKALLIMGLGAGLAAPAYANVNPYQCHAWVNQCYSGDDYACRSVTYWCGKFGIHL